MATARDLILGALRDLTILGEGDTATAQQVTDALDVLNEQIDSWNAEILPLYQIQEESLSLTGASSYTIGPTGVLVTTRPDHIERVWYRVSGVDYPVDIVNADRWAAIVQKSLADSWIEVVYYEPSVPNGTLRVYPQPSSGTLHFQSAKLLTEVTADTVISLPPGYRKGFRKTLAVELASQYGMEVPQFLALSARTAMRAIKARNNHMKSQSPIIEFANVGRGNILDG